MRVSLLDERELPEWKKINSVMRQFGDQLVTLEKGRGNLSGSCPHARQAGMEVRASNSNDTWQSRVMDEVRSEGRHNSDLHCLNLRTTGISLAVCIKIASSPLQVPPNYPRLPCRSMHCDVVSAPHRRRYAWQISLPLKSPFGPTEFFKCPQRIPWICRQAHPRHSSSSLSLSRRTILRALVHLPVALPLITFPARCTAICGEPDPQFAYFIDWTEDFAKSSDGRQIHYRRLGSRKKERKAKKFPVLYVGDGGVSLAAGETLELLGETDRRILFVDMLGVGGSQRLPEGGRLDRLKAVGVACEDVRSVLDAEGIGRKSEAMWIHLVAVGFGLEVAEELVRRMGAKGEGVQIASVVAEGWQPVKLVDGVITFEALQGKRVCAEEGAKGGNIDMVRMLYGKGEDLGDVVKRIGRMVPTLALRTLDAEDLGAGVEEKEVDYAGRLAHLVGTVDALKEIDIFFEQVERKGRKV